MIVSKRGRIFLGLLYFSLGVCYAQDAGSYAFIHTNVILTVEVDTRTQFILNVINLTDNFLVFEPKNLVLKSKDGKFSTGQVIDLPETDNRGTTWKYRGSITVPPKTAQGFSVLGPFGDSNQVESVTVKIGGKSYRLEALNRSEFNALASKISNIDLKSQDFKKQFELADLPSLGSVSLPAGTSEAGSQSVQLADGVNPPKIIERPPVSYTPEAQKAGITGVVKISGTITRNGEFKSAKVVKGLGYGLDERALEAVRNSWKFLPATKNGEVVEATVTINVEFGLSNK